LPPSATSLLPRSMRRERRKQMYYKEFLRARKAVVVYAIVLGIIWTLIAIISAITPMNVDVSGSSSPHAAAAAPPPIPWVVLFAVAGFFAAIVATVLGSTLSQENDGHLELALTKPYSRSAYASTMIAIDLAAIAAAELIALALIVLHIVFFHPGELQRMIAGPDAFFNVLRFVLFPLAWYAIIAGLSAGLRGKAGIVQGLIWPVALVLGLLREIPASGPWLIWHNVFAFINAFNPLIYISYQDRTADTSIQIVGTTPLPAALGAAILIAFVVAGWFAATAQWRRVEA
jgi:hypothetical protein